jgi:hypothetical protein
MTTIVHKRGTGIPAADDLAVGEIAIDTSTGTAYTKTNSGEVSAVGGGGGGGDPEWAKVSSPDHSTAIGYGANASSYATALGYAAMANDESAIAIGDGATGGNEHSIGVGSASHAAGRLAIAIGVEASSAENSCAIGARAKAEGEESIALGKDASADDWEFAISPHVSDVLFNKANVRAKSYLDANGNPATVSPSSIVEAFTTLRDEIVKEDNAEDAIATLADTLGDLIRKFEGMSK